MRRCRTRQPTFLIRCARFSVTTGAALIVSATAIGQTKNYPLDSPDGLRLHNVTGEPVVLQGKKGLRITISDEAQRRLNALPAQDQGRFPQFAIVEGIRFGDGVIEAEIAGAPRPDAGDAARGSVGINFRAQGDLNRRDTFNLRPTNGRADDQERRNHAVQYAAQKVSAVRNREGGKDETRTLSCGGPVWGNSDRCISMSRRSCSRS